MNKIKSPEIYLLIFISLLISSCVSLKKTKYIQPDTIDSISEVALSERENITIKSLDELFIRVISLDEKTYQFFNNEPRTGTGVTPDLVSYTVNDSGYINFPVVGDIFVKGLTLTEATEKIQTDLKKYLKEVTVIVKLMNKNITLLGEFNRPGRYSLDQNQVTIFDAIGLAGDLTDFGNPKKIIIIRQKNEKVQYHYLDITDKNIVNSNLYYLKPGDIIYAEPLQAKFWGIKTFPFATIFSSITTFITLLYFIQRQE